MPAIALVLSLIFVGFLAYALLKYFRKPSAGMGEQAASSTVDLKSGSTGAEKEPRSLKLSQAIKSWIPLLKSQSKDHSAWEAALIGADLGPKLTEDLLKKLNQTEVGPLEFFKSELGSVLTGADQFKGIGPQRPWVVFVVGVNGVGKTTTIVKLVRHFKAQNMKVGVIGADTFRKAAIEQLERGVQSVGGDFFSLTGSAEQSEGADPSAVIFDGLSKMRDLDLILVDTSGRLTNKTNLMEELKKMKRVSQKVIPAGPHDVWMVVDSTLGQNAVDQGRAFHQALGLTGLILTKLDGLSRGGTVFQLYRELNTPIRFLGVGETPDALKTFNSVEFIEDLFDPNVLNP